MAKRPVINGIYEIKNLITNDIYIGSSASKQGILRRWLDHKSLLRNNKHHSIILQKAWNKYKEESFLFSIVETCLPIDCVKYEQKYINLLNPKYNICKIAGNRLGCKQKGRKLSEKEIENFIKRNIDNGYWKENVKKAWASNKGKKQTEETKLKRSFLMKKNFQEKGINKNSFIALENNWEKFTGSTYSEDRKRKMVGINPNSKRPWILNKTTGIEYSFINCSQCAKFFNFKLPNMMGMFKKSKKYRNIVLINYV